MCMCTIVPALNHAAFQCAGMRHAQGVIMARPKVERGGIANRGPRIFAVVLG